MYDDEKAWKQHYDNWLTVKEELVLKLGLPKYKEEIKGMEYRLKIIQRLIDDYEGSTHE